jgi:flagellar biosynthetic protein FlhB
MARKRMLADVPTADVIVTNPTHFAVALKYVPGAAAPMVVAKGQDQMAMMIRKVARKARVPIIENKLLARSLHKQVDVGAGIPESLFQAVAEVLAYVYRLRKA